MAGLSDHPDPWVRATAATFGGHAEINVGNIAAAEEALARGSAGYREVGDRWGMLVNLCGLAEVAMARGDYDRALREYTEAYAVGERVNPDRAGQILLGVGRARPLGGDIDGGRADLERGIEVCARIGEHADAAQGFLGLCELARMRGASTRSNRSISSRARLFAGCRGKPSSRAIMMRFSVPVSSSSTDAYCPVRPMS